MLKLSISKEVESFRSEFAEWLRQNPPPQTEKESSLEAFEQVGREWQARLASGRWLGVHWPSEYGGRGLSLVEEAIVQEELVRVRSPRVLGLFGLTMVGPVLIAHGTEVQKERYLAKILSGEEIWCQGFSEPGAGSDLAAVRTKAKLEGDKFVVNGHKIWTSFAHIADWCFVLCRTDESSKRHHGLSYLLIDMRHPGISTRPLRQISGEEEFNEVFFDNVEVPRENLVGEIGEGWKIAISTLMYERVVLTFARQLQSEVVLRDLLERHGKHRSESVRNRLGEALAEACATRALAYRHLLAYATGQQPGPEGSMDKLLWSEGFQRLCKLACDLESFNTVYGEREGAAIHRYLYSRGRTIAAGSSEIQRNIIAERVLSLPRLGVSFEKRKT